MKLKMELIFRDRVGIVSDLSALLAGQALSIVSMEVERRLHEATDKAFVYLEADRTTDVDRAALFETLGHIPDLLEFRIVETLPAEERANRFSVVLDNIRDGVLSIDMRGRLTAINKVARDVYGCSEADLGRNFTALALPEHTLLESLEGRELLDAKREVATPGGRLQFFVTRRPIRDGEGRIIGAVEIARDMREIRKLARSIAEPTQVSFSDIVGQHPAISFAIAFARRIATTDSIVAIRGQSGTGKELFARAIHAASGRTGPFVPLNCAALPEQLLESELFGYERGAFTGGRREGKPGLFETARGGTVFLDEIGDMPLTSQAKILRVMQEQCVRRIGATAEIPVDVRILTATNRTLERLVEEGHFRQDLYYRINVLPIHIPPLKERADDIPLLAEHFLLQLASRLGKPGYLLSDGALARLHSHNWPGNVRELKNVVERAAILCSGDVVDAQYILFSHEMEGGLFGGTAALPDPTPAGKLKDMVGAFEKRIVADTLRKAGSARKAALRLGLSHTALLGKIRRYGLGE